jgi:hypothetical protein
MGRTHTKRKRWGKVKHFANKAELIEFIKNQTNAELENIDGFCGDNPKLLYAEIPKGKERAVLSVCRQYGIETNEHVHGKYWFYL